MAEESNVRVRFESGAKIAKLLDDNGEPFFTINLPRFHRWLKRQQAEFVVKEAVEEVDVEAGVDDEAAVKVTKIEVTRFINAYIEVRAKYSGERVYYGKSSKYYVHFQRATQQCKERGRDAYTFIEALTLRLTQIRGEGRAVVPWPQQLYGETADMMYQDSDASDAPAEVSAVRRAKAKQYIKLDDDEEYQEALARMRKKDHTVADVAYVEARQKYVYGQVKPWMTKVKQQLAEKEVKRP